LLRFDQRVFNVRKAAFKRASILRLGGGAEGGYVWLFLLIVLRIRDPVPF